MRGDYSMTLVEFVLTGCAIAAALIVFIALPDWIMGWVIVVLSICAFLIVVRDIVNAWDRR